MSDPIVKGLESLGNDVVSLSDDLADVTTDVGIDIADRLVDVGNTLVATGNTVYKDVADGAITAFNTASGGVVYAVDWSKTEATQIGKAALSAAGDIAHFSVELYDKAKVWAEDAWKFLTSFLKGSPPMLGGYNTLARDFAIALISTISPGIAAGPESIVKSWERDARKKGYTMALDFGGSIDLGSVTGGVQLGVYVDKTGKWGFLENLNVTAANIIPQAGVSLTMDLYMLFGGVSMYNGKDNGGASYYFIGGNVDIDGLIVGADVLLTTDFDFAGFQVTFGIGLDFEEEQEKGGTKSSVEVSPTVSGVSMYSVSGVSNQASTTQVACSATKDSSQATSAPANAAAAMTMKSSSILASDQIGTGNGNAFSDDVASVARITSITLRGSSFISAISITYLLHDGSTVTKSHGVASGATATLSLGSDEYILQVSGSYSGMVTQMTLTTSYGRTISAGKASGSTFTIAPGPHRPILGFYGNSDALTGMMYALGIYYRSGAPFTIQSKGSGLYLDVDGQMNASESDGASAVQQSATGGPSQHWLIVPSQYSPYDCIINEHTGLYLDAVSSSVVGTGVVLNTGNGSSTQAWDIEALSDGYSAIACGISLGVKDASTQAGATMQMLSGYDADSRRWRLAPAPIKVYAFTGGGFTGSFQAFGPGLYNMSQLTIGNDAIRSIRVPDGWRVTLYHDANFSGKTRVLTSDCQELGTMSGQVSSILVEMPPWGATLCTDANYSGTSRVFSPGRYASLSRLGYKNDALSSVKVPTGWRVTLFVDANFQGNMTVLTSDCANLKTLSANDSTSSVVVEQAPLGQVVLFKDANYKGDSLVLTPGKYDQSYLSSKGFDNAISSIKVPPNWTVLLYGNPGFSGSSQTLTADLSEPPTISIPNPLGGSQTMTVDNWVSSLIVIPG